MPPTSAHPRRLPPAAAPLLAATLAVTPAASAQVAAGQPAGPDTALGRWTASVSYLHLGAAPIRRDAARSMDVAVGYALRPGDPARAPRLEASWLRASRVSTQAQGVTVGASLPLWVNSALSVRPGVAVLAGWAEAQTTTTTYRWQGAPGTPHAGQSGTETVWRPVRGRTTGAGLSLAADVALSPAITLAGSVRRWAFTGPVIRPNRLATLVGVGLTVRPRPLAREAHAWWYGPVPRAAARPTVPTTAGTDSTAAGETR